MTTIYVVTSGDYSDYGINGIFDSREKAEGYIGYQKLINPRGDDCDIEEWELNEYSDRLACGFTCYRVYFTNIYQGDATVKEDDASHDREYPVFSAYGRNGDERIVGFVTYLWARDREGAFKIANEHRVRYVVEHEAEIAQMLRTGRLVS